MYDSEYQKKYREQHKDDLQEYNRMYYKENKEEIQNQHKEYRTRNRDSILEKKKLYYSEPENKKRKAERSKWSYQQNSANVKARQLARRQERKAFIDEVSLRYGCQNPGCKWTGPFEPYQLTFHHVVRSQKEIEVAKMHSWSFENIVKEINKCVVLCRNCHPMADKGLIEINEGMVCKI